MNVPKNLKYTSEHEWVRLEGDCVYIGITDFAQTELGDIVFVEFPEVGDILSSGDVFGTVEAVKTVADLYSPISGEVVEINESLENSPESINRDTYNDGWIIKIKISDNKELDQLLNSDNYKGMIS